MQAPRMDGVKAQRDSSNLRAKERGFGRSQPTNTLILDFQSLELWERNFCHLSHPVMVLCLGFLSKLIYSFYQNNRFRPSALSQSHRPLPARGSLLPAQVLSRLLPLCYLPLLNSLPLLALSKQKLLAGNETHPLVSLTVCLSCL